MTAQRPPKAIECEWSCRPCGQNGTTKVQPYPNESPKHTVERHQRQTRDRCVKGCLISMSLAAAVSDRQQRSGK